MADQFAHLRGLTKLRSLQAEIRDYATAEEADSWRQMALAVDHELVLRGRQSLEEQGCRP